MLIEEKLLTHDNNLNVDKNVNLLVFRSKILGNLIPRVPIVNHPNFIFVIQMYTQRKQTNVSPPILGYNEINTITWPVSILLQNSKYTGSKLKNRPATN